MACFETISATTGFSIAFFASGMSASAVAVFPRSMPVGSTTVMPGMPWVASHDRAAEANTWSEGQIVDARRSA